MIRPSDDAAPEIGEAAEPSPHDPGTPAADAPATRPPVMVSARLRGGPAAGRHVDVPRIAGSFPMFIGVDGANYVRDKGSADAPVYNWWPAGASSPAGDPSARTDTR